MDKLKICFVWVESFRNFRDAGFNFSSSDKFEYNSKLNIITKKKISELPSNFFGEQITEVTGLIGKNGSGKSNALELLCKVLKGGKTTISGAFIIITENKKRFDVYWNNPLKKYPSGNFDFKPKLYNGAIDPLKIIFFSNVYDERQNNFSKDISDISSNNRYSRRTLYTSRNRIKTDFEKQLDFINSESFDELEIETPESILIINKTLFNRFSTTQKQKYLGENNKYYKNFFTDFKRRLKVLTSQRKLFYSLVFSIFQETLFSIDTREISLDRGHDWFLDKFLEYNNHERLSTEKIVRNMFDWMKLVVENRSQFQNISNLRKPDLTVRLELLEKIRDIIEHIDIEYESEGIRNKRTDLYSINFRRNSKNSFLKFLIQLNVLRDFDINWKGISSGHKAYLNLFSLIYSEIRRVKNINLLICIDEGDLYLHPKWQIEFFSKLLNVIPQIYDGNIQLILTSHSPFLLSDIPKQCLTILDKDSESYSIDGINLKKETFAGNIYDLYEAPFFLGNQKKSVFSTKKIKEIINIVKNKNDFDNKEIKKLIELVGDDIINFHLKKIWENDKD